MMNIIQQLLGRKDTGPKVSEEKLTERHAIARQRVVGAFNEYLTTVDELLQQFEKDKHRGVAQNNNLPKESS